MKNRYFPKGHIIYNQGDIGNHMYFINSGTILVTTKDGSRATRKQGDFFGEGALLHPSQIRSATIKCKTPVHALEISREYFEKYVAESGLLLTLREKDKIRKRNRAKAILRLSKHLTEKEYHMGEYLFQFGEEGDSLYIVESGNFDILVAGKHVLTAMAGNLCGEYSVIFGRRRNSTAICASPTGCRAQCMSGADLRQLFQSSPDIEASIRDLCLRRDFKKAVVLRLQKEFPYDHPREAFDSVRGKDAENDGGEPTISLKQVGMLMRELNPEYSDEEIVQMVQALDLTNSGAITFDEFKKVFIADLKTSASI
jgi:CRP-like cAMP-binding protein